MVNICIPLIFSTLTRIEIITNAMDLRGFGKHKKRTWYSRIILFCQLHNHGRFWNPFVYGM